MSLPRSSDLDDSLRSSLSQALHSLSYSNSDRLVSFSLPDDDGSMNLALSVEDSDLPRLVERSGGFV